jgi:hypothetical protein
VFPRHQRPATTCARPVVAGPRTRSATFANRWSLAMRRHAAAREPLRGSCARAAATTRAGLSFGAKAVTTATPLPALTIPSAINV